ncbi:MAG TPA: NUDIX domain-containing protein [Candidatus Dormibacteraeota bacterium]|nr:NUDIX domain-containing protein [Candidatus Dormibacteraeota bacterium]
MTGLAWRLLAGLWHRLAGSLQWRLLWLTQAKFMVGVVGVVFDDQDRVLLLRNRFWPDGSWGLPAGYAHAGERFEDALAREVREETGCQIEDPRLLRLVSGYRLRAEAVFSARLLPGQPRPDGREVLAAGLFEVDALPAGLLRSHRAFVELVARERERGPERRPP